MNLRDEPLPAPVAVLGVTGLRRLPPGPAARRFVERACARVLGAVQAISPRCVVLSPLAEGADTLCAELALEIGLPLQVVRPYASFGDDFKARAPRRRYRHLRAAADQREDLPFSSVGAAAFEAAMARVVDRCDLLLAVWDGAPGRRGGTAQAVARATAMRRPWVQVDPERRRLRLHLPSATVADRSTA